jgi:hypothetical protein
MSEQDKPKSFMQELDWRKAFELAYTALIGFEVGFILDVIRQLR